MKIMDFINTLYLFVLGLSVGAMVGAIFIAPVLFNATVFVPDLHITLYQSGILMTQVFLKLNMLLLFASVFIAFYEALHVKSDNKIFILLSSVSIACIWIFVFYYTAYILEAQLVSEEATHTQTFNDLHHQSTIVYKIMLTSLSLLFLGRVYMFIKR